MADEGGDVVGHRLEAHRPVRRRRATVRLQVDADDPVSGGEGIDVRAEHLDRPEGSVQEDERVALSELLVGELDPVHVGQLGGGRCRWHRVLRGLVGAPPP